MQKVLVTGSNGQLATCFKNIDCSGLDILYTDTKALDITNKKQLEVFFKTTR